MIRNPFSPLALLGRFTLGRFFLFRKELGLLWDGFRHPATPGYLKLAMLAVPLYLISPIDIIPEFLPFLGLIDDFIIVPLVVDWIAKRLPIEVTTKRVRARADRSGTARRG